MQIIIFYKKSTSWWGNSAGQPFPTDCDSERFHFVSVFFFQPEWTAPPPPGGGPASTYFFPASNPSQAADPYPEFVGLGQRSTVGLKKFTAWNTEFFFKKGEAKKSLFFWRAFGFHPEMFGPSRVWPVSFNKRKTKLSTLKLKFIHLSKD